MNTARSRTAGAVVVLLLGLRATAGWAQTGHEVVNCFHQDLGTVQKTLAGDCDGRPVTDDEATVIRQQRRDYIQRVLSKAPHPDVAGKHLAGVGSGFFIAADGSVVTSHHVIANCDLVSITPTFGEMKLATGIASEEMSDLALLSSDIAPPAVPYLSTNAGPSLLQGAFVIGYPSQGLVTIEPILTAVEVVRWDSSTRRGPAIVLRGDIRRGNSGGPLLDGDGNVIGVVFAKVDSVNVYKETGQVVREIGLASTGNTLEAFLKSQGVGYQEAQSASPQPPDRILEEARPFLVQIGCWR